MEWVLRSTKKWGPDVADFVSKGEGPEAGWLVPETLDALFDALLPKDDNHSKELKVPWYHGHEAEWVSPKVARDRSTFDVNFIGKLPPALQTVDPVDD